MKTLILNNQCNIGHICTRQPCDQGLAEKMAMRWISATQERADYTFADLDRASNRCANLLATLGFVPGDTFFTFLPKAPEQFFAFLGALKLQVICGTLFANFGDEALLDRLGVSQARGVLTKKSFLKKLGRIQAQIAKSGVHWTPNPICTGHRIRKELDTQSGFDWTVNPI